MLTLTSPYSHIPADETELAPGYEAHLKRYGPGSSDDDFNDSRFARKTPNGIHVAHRHSYGRSKRFLARCTATPMVFGTYPAQVSEPPPNTIAAIPARRPGSSLI